MNRKVFLLAAFLFASFLSWSQSKSFIFSKKKGVIQLKGDSSLVTFGNSRTAASGSRTREVTVNGETLNLSTVETSDGRLQFIKNANGEKLATVFLGSKKHYNVVLQDGTEYEWKLLATTWFYTQNGLEVVKGEVVKAGKNKTIVIKPLNSQTIPSVLELVALERGTERIHAGSPGVTIAIVGVVLTAIRILALSD